MCAAQALGALPQSHGSVFTPARGAMWEPQLCLPDPHQLQVSRLRHAGPLQPPSPKGKGSNLARGNISGKQWEQTVSETAHAALCCLSPCTGQGRGGFAGRWQHLLEETQTHHRICGTSPDKLQELFPTSSLPAPQTASAGYPTRRENQPKSRCAAPGSAVRDTPQWGQRFLDRGTTGHPKALDVELGGRKGQHPAPARTLLRGAPSERSRAAPSRGSDMTDSPSRARFRHGQSHPSWSHPRAGSPGPWFMF